MIHVLMMMHTMLARSDSYTHHVTRLSHRVRAQCLPAQSWLQAALTLAAPPASAGAAAAAAGVVGGAAQAWLPC
jgi:hypothetical protein